jgi:hypothetical protein
MVIVALEHVPQCYTWEDGAVIAKLIRSGFAHGEDVVVSFKGVENVPSSFVNGAFVSLLDDYDVSYLRSHLSIVDSNSAINEMIRRRIVFESQRNPSEERALTQGSDPSPA